jgi:hypothetical protein
MFGHMHICPFLQGMLFPETVLNYASIKEEHQDIGLSFVK